MARNYITPQENDHGYNTPLVIRYEGKEALLVGAASILQFTMQTVESCCGRL
jgi:hypothetical protein